MSRTSHELDKKRRKLVEVLLTLGTLLGVVVQVSPAPDPVLPYYAEVREWFSFIFIVFLITAIWVYSDILFEIRRQKFRDRWSVYTVMSLAFSFAFSLMVPLVSILSEYSFLYQSYFSQNTTTGVAISTALYSLAIATVGLLGLKIYDLLTVRKEEQDLLYFVW